MKIPDEMCNAMFAKLPLEDKRWLILFAEAVHVGTKAAAKALSDLCNLGGGATLPMEMP